MAWVKYPHTVTVYPVTTAIDGTTKLEANPVVGSGVSKTVDVQPSPNPNSVYQEWGLELINPVVLFAVIADFASFAVNTRVVHESITYVVRGVKQWQTGDTSMDYTKAIMERLNGTAP